MPPGRPSGKWQSVFFPLEHPMFRGQESSSAQESPSSLRGSSPVFQLWGVPLIVVKLPANRANRASSSFPPTRIGEHDNQIGTFLVAHCCTA